MTGWLAASTIQDVHPLLRRRVRPLAAVLIVALATVASLSCLDAAGLTAQERACCAEMTGHCGATMAREHGCCSTDAGDQAFQQVAGSKSFSLQERVLIQVATIAFLDRPSPFTSVVTPSSMRESRGSPPGSRDLPLYLAISTLRV